MLRFFINSTKYRLIIFTLKIESSVSSGKIIFKFPAMTYSALHSSKYLEKLQKKTEENRNIQKVNFWKNSSAKRLPLINCRVTILSVKAPHTLSLLRAVLECQCHCNKESSYCFKTNDKLN